MQTNDASLFTVDGAPDMSASEFQAQESIQLWQCSAISGVVYAIIAIIFFDYAVINASGFCGSYLIVRGLSLFFGGFPNEFLVYDSLVNSKFSQ